MLKIVTPKGLKAEIKKYFQQKEVKGPFIVVGYTGIGKTQISFPLFYEQGCNLCREFIMEGEATDQEMLAALEEYKGQRGCFERTIMNEGDARFLLEKGYDVVLLRPSFEEWREWALQKNSEGEQNIEQFVIDFLEANPDQWDARVVRDRQAEQQIHKQIEEIANRLKENKAEDAFKQFLPLLAFLTKIKISKDEVTAIIAPVMNTIVEMEDKMSQHDLAASKFIVMTICDKWAVNFF